MFDKYLFQTRYNKNCPKFELKLDNEQQLNFEKNEY